MPAAERQSPWASGQRRPHFFKVLMGDFKKRLKIPPSFCKHIPWEASRSRKRATKSSRGASSMAAALDGPSGRTWPVVIRRSAEGTFFTSGWPKFVRDQELRQLEFLVFRYDGHTRFTVMAFDTSGCEREDLLAPDGGGAEQKKRVAARAKKNKDSVGKELVPYRAPPSDHHACSDEELLAVGSAVIKAEVPADADELAPLCVMTPAKQVGSSTRVATKTRSIHEDDLAEIPPAPVRRYSGYVSRRRPVTGAERQRAAELAYAFRSSLPYCVVRMGAYYSFMMRFPTGFSRQHLPRERTDMVLRDPAGGNKAWTALYIPSTRDRRLSRGWCAFARGNCLEEGDYCVFELVGAAEFRVHIFRVVEPPVSAVRLSALS